MTPRPFRRGVLPLAFELWLLVIWVVTTWFDSDRGWAFAYGVVGLIFCWCVVESARWLWSNTR